MEFVAVYLAGALPPAFIAFAISIFGVKGVPWKNKTIVFLVLWFSCLLLQPIFNLIVSAQDENTKMVIGGLGPTVVAVIMGKAIFNRSVQKRLKSVRQCHHGATSDNATES